MKLVIENMTMRNSGHIVNITSYASLVPFVKMSDYSFTAAGLSNFHNALRLELKHDKSRILTTIVHPYIYKERQSEGENRAPGEVPTKQQLQTLKKQQQKEYNISNEIYYGIISKREEIYIPWFYKQIGLILKLIPAIFFDKLMVLYYKVFLKIRTINPSGKKLKQQ